MTNGATLPKHWQAAIENISGGPLARGAAVLRACSIAEASLIRDQRQRPNANLRDRINYAFDNKRFAAADHSRTDLLAARILRNDFADKAIGPSLDATRQAVIAFAKADLALSGAPHRNVDDLIPPASASQGPDETVVWSIADAARAARAGAKSSDDDLRCAAFVLAFALIDRELEILEISDRKIRLGTAHGKDWIRDKVFLQSITNLVDIRRDCAHSMRPPSTEDCSTYVDIMLDAAAELALRPQTSSPAGDMPEDEDPHQRWRNEAKQWQQEIMRVVDGLHRRLEQMAADAKSRRETEAGVHQERAEQERRRAERAEKERIRRAQEDLDQVRHQLAHVTAANAEALRRELHWREHQWERRRTRLIVVGAVLFSLAASAAAVIVAVQTAGEERAQESAADDEESEPTRRERRTPVTDDTPPDSAPARDGRIVPSPVALPTPPRPLSPPCNPAATVVELYLHELEEHSHCQPPTGECLYGVQVASPIEPENRDRYAERIRNEMANVGICPDRLVLGRFRGKGAHALAALFESPDEAAAAYVQMKDSTYKARNLGRTLVSGEARAAPPTELAPQSAPIALETVTPELAPDDVGFVDDRGGGGWSERCYGHIRAARLANAKAACDRALAQAPTAAIKASILYNFGLIAEKSGDYRSARQLYEQSLPLQSTKKGADIVRRSLDQLPQ